MISKLLYRLVQDFRPIREKPNGAPKEGFFQDIMRRGGESLYLRRHFLRKGRWASYFLHWFATADQDEWVHDHPWRFGIAIVLTGWYIEERAKWFDPRLGAVLKRRKIRWFNFLTARTLHRVAEAKPGTWTLFIHFGRIKEWGFFEGQTLPQRKGDTDELQPTDCVVYYQPYLDQYLERRKNEQS